MPVSRRIFLVTLLICCILTGCWNRRDPELLGFVLATGFDYDPQTGLYQIVAQVANPLGSASQEQSGGGVDKKPFWVVEARGHTPYEARENLALKSSVELFWAHNSILVLGEDLAREGILPVLDLFERERQLRIIARPMVVEGDVVALLEAEFPLEESSSRGLWRQATTMMFELPVNVLRESIINLARPGVEIMIGRVGNVASQTDASATTGTPPPAKMAGAAVFKEDVMVGWIGEREVAGWHWVQGRAHRATLIIPSPLDRSPLSVEVHRSHAKMAPRVEGDEVAITIKIHARGRVQEQTEIGDLVESRERHLSLERRTATVIKNDVKLALKRAQELNSDYLGLGNLIHRRLPQEWERLEPRWEEIFPTLTLDIQVQVDIVRAGLVTGAPTIK